MSDLLVSTAERYMLAVKKLGEQSGYNKLTFFEAPISKMPNDALAIEATNRWFELNYAGAALAEAIRAAKATPSASEAPGQVADGGAS